MANLTQATTFHASGQGSQKVYSLPFSFRIANTRRIFAGAICGLPGANALTANRGYLDRWQDQVNIQYAGIAEAQSWTEGGLITSAQTGTPSNVNSVLGATGNTPIPEITVEMGPMIVIRTPVAGVAAQTDVWRTSVSCNTDNYADFSTTASSYAPTLGRVIYWVTSTTASVYLYGAALRLTTI